MNTFNIATLENDLACFNKLALNLNSALSQTDSEVEQAKIKLTFLDNKSVKKIIEVYYEYFNNFLTRDYFSDFYSIDIDVLNEVFDSAKMIDELLYEMNNKSFLVDNTNHYMVKIANQFILTKSRVNALLIDCFAV